MLNKLTIQGRILKDFEVKTSENGTDYVNFTIVWSEKYNEKQQTCFLKSVAYRHNAKFLEKFFEKGDMVLAEGKITTEKYNDNGEDKWVTQFLVDKLHFLGNRGATKKEEDELEPLPF